MSNKEIFSRTFGFSVRRFFFSILSFIVAAAICVLGFRIGEKVLQKGLIGLAIGAVTTGELPDDVMAEGKRVVKSRFRTVAVYFALTGAIKGIFSQIGNALTKAIQKIGGVFSGIFYFIALQFKDAFAQLALFVQEMAADMNDIPTEDSFRVLDGRSAKFRKMHEQIV